MTAARLNSPARPAARDARYLSLDLWRGVACLLIVIHHSTLYLTDDSIARPADTISKLLVKFLDHFWIGVPIFFVISGYCISAACDNASSKSRSLKWYFYRRFRRIYPPYWITVLVLLAMVGLLQLGGASWLYYDANHGIHAPSSFAWSQIFGNLTLTEGWRSLVFGEKTWFFFGPAWTLCYEEQFYAICGLMLLLPRSWFFPGLALLTAAVGATVFVNAAVVPLPIQGFFFDGHWLLFAAGCLVYFRLRYLGGSAGRVADMALIGICAGMIGCRFLDKVWFSEEYFVGCAFAAMISLLHRWDLQLVTAPILRPLIYCGMMCYSLYLIHWPVVKLTSHLFYSIGIQSALATMLISFPVSFVAALAAGWFFHLKVERRFLNSPPVEPWKAQPSPSGVQGDLAGGSVSGGKLA